MTQIAEYFETDPSTANSVTAFMTVNTGTAKTKLKFRLFFDTNAGCRYFSLFATKQLPLRAIIAIAKAKGKMLYECGGSDVETGEMPRANFVRNNALGYFCFDGKSMANMECGILPDPTRKIVDYPFTGRVFLYTDYELSEAEKSELFTLRDQGIFFIPRGPTYAEECSNRMKPAAFISHDSRDKAEVARPLAQAFSRLGTKVWFDEYSLKIGDSLREGIEKGLKECGYCIFIITPNFLVNGGWSKREYDSIFTRELVEEKKLILPIRHGVTQEDVFEYSPILADRLGYIWDGNADKAARKLRPLIDPD